MKSIRRCLALIVSACAVLTAGCGQNAQAKNEEGNEMEKTISGPYTAENSISDVMNDPVFGNYGRLLLPADAYYWSGDRLNNLRLTWYNYVNPEKTVEIVNTLHDRAAIGE